MLMMGRSWASRAATGAAALDVEPHRDHQVGLLKERSLVGIDHEGEPEGAGPQRVGIVGHAGGAVGGEGYGIGGLHGRRTPLAAAMQGSPQPTTTMGLRAARRSAAAWTSNGSRTGMPHSGLASRISARVTSAGTSHHRARRLSVERREGEDLHGGHGLLQVTTPGHGLEQSDLVEDLVGVAAAEPVRSGW